jgi:hypothetical protein
MNITQTDDNRWQLLADDGRVLGTFATNAEAWCTLDRMDGEPISKAEARTSWIVDQMIGCESRTKGTRK